MFDEKSSIWLDLFKVAVGICTFGIAIGGFVLCLKWAESSALDEIAWMPLIFGFLIAFVNQANGMLIANVIGNIQRIRECAEESLKIGKTEVRNEINEEQELPEL